MHLYHLHRDDIMRPAMLRISTRPVVMVVDHAKQFEAHSSQFFTDFDWLVMFTSCSGHDDEDRRTDRSLYPCACAWSNEELSLKYYFNVLHKPID